MADNVQGMLSRTFMKTVYLALYTLQTTLLTVKNSLFVCLTGRPCGTRLGPGGPGSSKSSSQAKKPI